MHRARGNADGLKAIYDVLVEEVGTDEASELWWAVFAAEDAPITG